MQVAKPGGSLGTITGSPWLSLAWLFSSMYIQWSIACSEIGLPETLATSPLGMLAPHPETATAMATKKAQSARIDLRDFIGGRW